MRAVLWLGPVAWPRDTNRGEVPREKELVGWTSPFDVTFPDLNSPPHLPGDCESPGSI